MLIRTKNIQVPRIQPLTWRALSLSIVFTLSLMACEEPPMPSAVMNGESTGAHSAENGGLDGSVKPPVSTGNTGGSGPSVAGFPNTMMGGRPTSTTPSPTMTTPDVGSPDVESVGGAVEPQNYPWFERDILPIMNQHCTGCHGERPAGYAPPGFRLDQCEPEGTVGAKGMASRIIARALDGQNGFMPRGPMRAVSDEEDALIRRWVSIGSPCLEQDIDLNNLPQPNERHHPENYAQPSVHGLDLKLQASDCRECHGDTLRGGSSLGCDGCHPAEWRTDCTFCHGGQTNETGAPPRGLDPMRADTFPAHTAHVQGTIHGPFDCSECHLKPQDVLSMGHIFDGTPGRAEVNFEGGLSSNGTYESGVGCDTVYCHGNGRINGSYSVNGGPVGCSSCHAGPQSLRDEWSRMSGRHEDHLRDGITCGDCHGATIAQGTNFADVSLHVNGQANVLMPDTIGWDPIAKECSGTCHGAPHSGRGW